MTRTHIIGDQGQRKYDEGLVNQVNEQIEAEERREELEKRRAELQTVKKTKSEEEKPIILLPGNCIFLEAKEHISVDGRLTKYQYPDTIIAQDTMYPGLDWYKTHEILQSQGLAMPTIRQHIDKMTLIKKGLLQELPVYDGNKNNIAKWKLQELWNKYFSKQQQGWNGQWLDARFEEDSEEGLFIIKYCHRLKKDKTGAIEVLVSERIETLEAFVNENCHVLLGSANYQGLPTKKTIDHTWYFIKPTNNSVAGFDADTSRARLGCDWNPGSTSAVLAVCPTKNYD